MTDPTPDDIRAELERVLSSRCFAHAGRARDFLRFVVEETLAGAGARLKGYVIGTEVFGRPPDFDPQADPLVRVEAGRLRSRLAEYYQHEGIANPLKIELPRGGYAVKWHRAAAMAPAVEQAAESPPPRQWRWRAAVVAFGLVSLFVLSALVWQMLAWRPAEPAPAARVVVTESPRVIVTPFENFGIETPELAQLAAGLTEEIMVALGRLDVRVIAAEPRWLDSGRVSEMSTHDYVLSGSVRLAGNRVRVAARLIERGTGVQLWSRTFDRGREFQSDTALQAAVAQEIAGVALPYGPIFDMELARVREGSPLLRDCLARYLDYRRTMDDAPFRQALECYQSLSLRQPSLAEVWAGLGMLYLDDYGYRYGNTASLEASFMMAREAIERALALDRGVLLANVALARLQLFDGDRAALYRTVDDILEREPTNVEARAYLGITLALAGDSRGIALADEALARSPRQPGIVYMAYAVDHLRHGRAREALASAERVANPNWFPAQMVIAASAGLCGDERVAARAGSRLLELYPNFEAEAMDLFQRWQHDPALDAALLAGLDKAGVHVVGRESRVTP